MAAVTAQDVPPPQVDPTLSAAVGRFFATQEAEDVDGYLALWSRSAERPQAASLESIFDSGDDRFSDLTILKAAPAGGRMRVQLQVRRQRTMAPRVAGGRPFVQSSVMRWSLTYVKEGEDWMLVREGPAAEDLAAELVEAPTPEAREALLASEPELVNQSLLMALGRRGSAAAMRQAFRDAQRIYELTVDIARRTGHRREEGEALQNVANALYFQMRFPEALAAYEQRLVVERERGDDAAAASALVGIANIRYSLAEYTEALARYRQALAIQERVEDTMGLATSLVSTGNVRYLQGDYAGAIADYRRGRDLYRTMFYKDGEARALEGLGRVYTAQGDYAAALEAFAGVLDEGRARGDRPRQGLATQSIGEVHFRLGNLEHARASFEESRGHFEAAGDRPNMGRVWQGLAVTDLVAGKFAAAEQEYGRSMTVCGGAGDRECSTRARVGLAFAQSAQEKYAEAVASYRKAIEEFGVLGRREEAARAEVGLSQALAGTGDYPAAIAAAERARHAAVGSGSDDVLWRALTAEARALRKSGRSGDALAVARAAVSVIDRQQLAALDRPGSSAPSDAAAGFATFSVLQAEAGDAAGAFTSAERMRALDLRAALATNEREISRGMTPDEREWERRASSELLSLHAQLSRERGLPKPDAARVASLEARVADATSKRGEAMAALYERLPDLRVWRGLAPAPGLEDAATLVTAPGTVILSFVVDDDDVVAVTVWRDETAAPAGSAEAPTQRPMVAAHVTVVKRRALAESVAALQSPAVLRDAAQWRKAAGEFVGLLHPAVVRRMSAAAHLVVLPHEMLWRVPFEALPIEDGYLGDRTRVSYTGSIAALVRGEGIAASPADTMLAVGAPDVSDQVRERLKQTAPGWTIRSPEAVDRELQAVVPPERGRVLSGQAATEPALRADVSSAAIVHVAAPFRINGASPLFSPILLAGDRTGADAAQDGALEAREIVNLELRAGLAVLSDGAAISMRDGAGAIDAVQWAWLAAGVPALVLARWPADAEAGNALLAELHRRLRDGATPREALHAAREAVRRRPQTAAPVHWAGWMLIAAR